MRRGYCITKFEYIVSTYLIYQYVCSVTEFIGEYNVTKTHAFVRGNFKPNEMHC